MNPRCRDVQSWLGVWIAALLLLAACAGRAQVVEPTQAAPVALATATPSPAPTPAAQIDEPPIPSYVLPYSLAWDPLGRRLAYTGSDGRAWLRDPASDAARPVAGLEGGEAADLRVAWSPGGDQFLVYGQWSTEDPRWTGLWLVAIDDAGTGTAQPIVAPVARRSPVEQNSGAIDAAAWSPDGTQVAYTWQAEAWVYSLADGDSRPVTALAETPLARTGATEPFDGVREVAWSPDGAFLALGLSCNCPSPWSGVGIVDLSSRETRLLVDGGQGAAWSPDGRWITFQNAAGDWTGGSTFDFYGVEPAGGAIANLTRSNPGWDPLRPAEGSYQDAPYQTARLRWGPDGRYLFETLDYLTPAEIVPQRGFAIRDGPDGSAEMHLGSPESWYLFPAWLADGRTAYLEADAAAGSESVFAARRAVVGAQAAPVERANVHGAAWAPDGSALALCVSDGPALPPDEVVILSLGGLE